MEAATVTTASPTVPAPATAIPPSQTTLPDLTVPQGLAFAAFLVVAGLTLWSTKTLTDPEFHQVRKLAIFLIGALLPSDAVIRFGRNLFVKGQTAMQNAAAAATARTAGTATAPTDTGAGAAATGADANAFRRTTLAQLLAFATFLVIAALALTGDSIDHGRGKEVVDVAAFLIGALLPSEAAIKLGRSLYLRHAPNVTRDHLRKI